MLLFCIRLFAFGNCTRNHTMNRFSFLLSIFVCSGVASEAFAFGFPPVGNSQPVAAAPVINNVPRRPILRTKAIQATGWTANPLIIGHERKVVKSKPIVERPNRLLHFYGNTVRFIHYRNVPSQPNQPSAVQPAIYVQPAAPAPVVISN